MEKCCCCLEEWKERCCCLIGCSTSAIETFEDKKSLSNILLVLNYFPPVFFSNYPLNIVTAVITSLQFLFYQKFPKSRITSLFLFIILYSLLAKYNLFNSENFGTLENVHIVVLQALVTFVSLLGLLC